MLFQVILPLERLAADLTGERDVVLVTALVDHQVVGLGEAALAVLADKFTLGSHFAAKLPPVVTLHLHNREHGGRCPLLVGSSHTVWSLLCYDWHKTSHILLYLSLHSFL